MKELFEACFLQMAVTAGMKALFLSLPWRASNED